MKDDQRRRLVLDTNVLVSALLFRYSIPGRVLERAVTPNTLLVSGPTWSELTEVILRPKFQRYASVEKRGKALASLETTWVAITQQVRLCRDPKDNMILEVALNGRADLIITGDKDLLSLGSFGEILILTPAQYVARE